jgi:hypothetical protein
MQRLTKVNFELHFVSFQQTFFFNEMIYYETERLAHRSFSQKKFVRIETPTF